jgi:hypothetical protein
VVLKQEFSQQAAFQISTCILHWSVMIERKKGFGLLDLGEFRSQCQKFRFTGQPAWMIWVECDPCEIVPNPQA